MITNIDLKKLNSLEASELIEFAFSHFKERAAIGTSFQLTGMILLDFASKLNIPFRIFTVDTLRLHPETYELKKEVEENYNIKIECFSPNSERIKNMIDRFGEYLFFTDNAKQEYCCNIRKVEPNKQALKTLDCWITGLREDQSESRAETKKAEIIEIEGREILRLCPLVDWTEDKAWDYTRQNNLPYNKLYDHGYATIGCIICSTPILPGEDKRAGRWRWQNNQSCELKKECGIHLVGKK